LSSTNIFVSAQMSALLEIPPITFSHCVNNKLKNQNLPITLEGLLFRRHSILELNAHTHHPQRTHNQYNNNCSPIYSTKVIVCRDFRFQ